MIQGSIVALVTPMVPDGALDFVRLDRLVDFHLEQGTDAILTMGTTGESATLNPEEAGEVIQRVVERVAGRIPVVAGTGTNSTAGTIAQTRRAKAIGADACLLVTPYYNKPTQEGLYRHFAAVAEAVDIPQILYNVPDRTACDISPETIARLAPIFNIIGIKEASRDPSRIREILDRSGPGFRFYSGDDATGSDACLAGAKGVFSITANLVPGLMHAMCASAIAGDKHTTDAINALLAPLHRDLFIESNPIPIKWALCEMGLILPGIRLPLTWLSEGCRESLRGTLQAAGVL